MVTATYSHDFDGRRFQLPIDQSDVHRLEVLELGLRASFALAQENESSAEARPFILSDRFTRAVGVMDTQRFGVTTTVFVDASDAGEAALIIERDLAGRFDSDLVSVSAQAKAGYGTQCPACGSQRIEHHEDIVARRHFRRVGDDGVLVFDGFTDSFDDDGVRPRLWCGDCSQEWALPEQGVEFE